MEGCHFDSERKREREKFSGGVDGMDGKKGGGIDGRILNFPSPQTVGMLSQPWGY